MNSQTQCNKMNCLFTVYSQLLLTIIKIVKQKSVHRVYLAFLGVFGANGAPLSFPRSFISKARSIFPRMAWFGLTALLDSYSLITCGFSQILVANSFCDHPLA